MVASGDGESARSIQRNNDPHAHARRLRAVALAASGLVGAATFDDLKAVLREACSTVLTFDVFTLALYDEETRTLEFLAAEELGFTRSVRASALAGTPSLEVIESGRSLRIDRRDDPRRLNARIIGDEIGIPASLIISPILSGSAPLGVLSVQSYQPDVYDDLDVEVLEIIASLAASAILNVRLTAQRKAWETALGASKERLEALVSASPVAIITLDPGGRVETWNPAAEQILGVPARAIRSRRIASELPDLSGLFDELRRYADSGSPVLGVEAVHERADGTTVDLGISCAPIRKASGRTAETLYTVADLTDQKEAEAALRDNEERFRHAQKMEAVGRLAGGVAHDFNNLLTAIMGNVEFALARVDEDDELCTDILEVQDAAERAARLTRQLLAFSRRQMLAPQSVVLNEIIEQMMPMLKRVISEDIYLRTSLSEDLHPVWADPAHIEQIVLNLILNARDATCEGGRVEIETRNVELTEEDAARLTDPVTPGRYAALSVEDEGHGMSSEVLEQVFEPFFTTKRPGEGTGLGLSTVYGTVRQNGGFIEAVSRPSEGARFTVYLPRTTAEPRARQDSAGLAPHGNEAVLLVEDELAVRTFARRVLARAGYAVHEAGNGETGRSMLLERAAEFDLVVTDVVMPQMSGPKMVASIRASGIDLPVLFMTGYSEQALDRYGMTGSSVDLLEKPFSADALLEKVRSVLDKARR